jgi:hypothetical protein
LAWLAPMGALFFGPRWPSFARPRWPYFPRPPPNVQGQGELLAGRQRLDGGGSRAGRTWRHCTRHWAGVSMESCPDRRAKQL